MINSCHHRKTKERGHSHLLPLKSSTDITTSFVQPLDVLIPPLNLAKWVELLKFFFNKEKEN